MADNVRVEGLPELVRGLQQFPETLQGGLRLAIDEGLLLLQGRLAVYATQVPGSRYERTGQLGSGWSGAEHTVRMAGKFVEGSATNRTPWTGYVQSEAMQVPVHQGRWQTAEEVIEEIRPQIDRLLQEAGERAVGGVARMVG